MGAWRNLGEKHVNSQMICPQLRIVLPTEGIESGDRYLRNLDHWLVREQVCFKVSIVIFSISLQSISSKNF